MRAKIAAVLAALLLLVATVPAVAARAEDLCVNLKGVQKVVPDGWIKLLTPDGWECVPGVLPLP